MKKPEFLCVDFFLDIILPNRCPSCDRVIEWNKDFCDKCEESLEYIPELEWYLYFPHEIGDKPVYYDYANALFKYKGNAKNAVLSLKSGYCKKVARYAAERLVLKLESDEMPKPDIVTAVPMFWRKKGLRGYNQAEVFALELARQLKCPTNFKLLGHDPSFKAQHGMKTVKERIESADKVLYVRNYRKRLDGMTILICDDIFTSGATLNTCSRLLKQMGAERVFCASICKTFLE